MKNTPVVILLFLLAAALPGADLIFYMYSAAGFVDTVEIAAEDFRWEDFPEYDFAFAEKPSGEDRSYLLRGFALGERPNFRFIPYQKDWRGHISGDSLRVVFQRGEESGIGVIAEGVIADHGKRGGIRLHKPDQNTLFSRRDLLELHRKRDFAVLVTSERHYPELVRMNFQVDPEPIILTPRRKAAAGALYRGEHLKRFRLERGRPAAGIHPARNGWAEVPIYPVDSLNRFELRKFGYWKRELSLDAGNTESLYLKPWLYFNLPATWIGEAGVDDVIWPSDVIFGIDASGVIPGLHEKLAPLGLEYEFILSPFPTGFRAGLEWHYGDLWRTEIYMLSLYDSNPLRPFGRGYFLENELSGKLFMGRKAWQYFPIFIKGCYGGGEIFEPEIYKYRYLDDPEAQTLDGRGFYLSGGFDLWFFESGIIHPSIEAGVVWGGGRMRSESGEILSENDEEDDNTFPFIRIDLRP